MKNLRNLEVRNYGGVVLEQQLPWTWALVDYSSLFILL